MQNHTLLTEVSAPLWSILVLATVLGGCEEPRKDSAPAPAPAAPSNTVEQAAQTLQGGGGTYAVAAVSNGGALRVTATYTGDSAPEPIEVPVNIDIGTCAHKVFTEELLVDKGAGGIKNVVVRLEGIAAGKAAPESITISNKDCAFVPHVGVAMQGMKLQLKNEDPVLHTTHPFIDGRHFFNKPLPAGSAPPNPRTIRKAGLMEVKCDVHDWMRAWIVVHTNPYAAVSDSSGSLTIEEIPPGTYPYVAWHEQLGEQKGEVTITAGQTAELALKFAPREG